MERGWGLLIQSTAALNTLLAKCPIQRKYREKNGMNREKEEEIYNVLYPGVQSTFPLKFDKQTQKSLCLIQ